jgi:hypothetical protein
MVLITASKFILSWEKQVQRVPCLHVSEITGGILADMFANTSQVRPDCSDHQWIFG